MPQDRRTHHSWRVAIGTAGFLILRAVFCEFLTTLNETHDPQNRNRSTEPPEFSCVVRFGSMSLLPDILLWCMSCIGLRNILGFRHAVELTRPDLSHQRWFVLNLNHLSQHQMATGLDLS